MASQEERMLILKMIDEGKISADEGARLLAAIQAPEEGGDGADSSEQSSSQSRSRSGPSRTSRRSSIAESFGDQWSVASRNGSARNVRVRVSDSDTDQDRVDLNVPLKIVEFGLRFVPETIDDRIENIRSAVNAAEAGPVLEFKDSDNSNRIEISLE